MQTKYKPQLDPIQFEIITKLITKKSARFSELQPENVENDKFNYHLKFLVMKGLLQKDEMQYSLTIDGRKLISNLNPQGEVFDLFKASVALFVVKDLGTKDSQILMQKRTRYPFFGDTSSVAGKIKWGERAEDCAKRKLFEETGLSAEFKLFGILRKTRKNSEGLVLEDTIYHSCYAENPTGELIDEQEYGLNFWMPFADVLPAIGKNVDGGEFSLQEYESVLNGDLSLHYYHQISEVESY
jgi:ADP-ribose pyrophosphatase YjhB (NUDIX family)/predicted transcriptional regulator